MGFEPMMRVLQTLALPLGHVARTRNPGNELLNWIKNADCRFCYVINNQQTGEYSARAGDGTRTHDLLLGKEAFYQLNYTRIETCLR